ncbi:MAG: glycosyltransferase [Acidimicrobiales bacterium]
MLKVLWVTPYPPDGAGGGGQIRQARLLDSLAAAAEIRLVTPGPVVDDRVRAATGVVEVAAARRPWREHHPWGRRLADVVAAAAARQPIEVRAQRGVRASIGPAVDAAMADFDPDVVLVEFAGLAPLLTPARHGRARWVLTLHNLPSRMAAHQAQVMPHRRQRWLLARDARAAARFERGAAAAFDAVIVCTDEDAAFVTGRAPHDPSTPVIVVPNGTDVDRYHPTPLPAEARLVFTGALYTVPNVDALRWFCREVLPRVRSEVPSACLDIVGQRPAPEVRTLAEPAVVAIHADVASVEPYFEAARVAVVPVRVGSGSRLKALDALAAGRPVVGTTIGLEGLGLRPGEHALVADDAPAFAAAVVRLLRDDEAASNLAAAGRRAVEQRFGWVAIGAAFTDAVVTLAAPAATSRQ